MSAEVALLAYATCGLVIVIYAWVRSTTTPGIAFLMVAYLMPGATVVASFADISAQHPGGAMVPGTIAHLQVVTGGLLGWLVVRRAVEDNAPGASPSFSGFVIKSLSAILIGIGISLFVHVAESDPLAGTNRDLRLIVIGLPLCLAAMFFRDHQIADGKLPTWLRCAEICGCISTMALGLSVLYLGQLVPLPIDALHGWRLAVTMILPVSLAMVIGGCVPHIGRAEFHSPPVPPRELVRRQQG